MSEPQEQMTDEALAGVQDGADAVATPDEGAGATLAAAPDEAMSPEAAPSQDEDATIAADAPEQGHAQEDAAEDAAPEEAAQDSADGEPEEAPADDQPSEGAAEDAAPEEAAQDGADGESEATPANDQPSEGAAEGAATEEGAAQDQPLEDTVSQEVSTAHMPHVDPADRDEVDPSLGDVARTAGKYARGRMDKVREFFATHLVVVGVSCVCLLVAIFAAVMFARDLASMPEIESVERDARGDKLRIEPRVCPNRPWSPAPRPDRITRRRPNTTRQRRRLAPDVRKKREPAEIVNLKRREFPRFARAESTKSLPRRRRLEQTARQYEREDAPLA